MGAGAKTLGVGRFAVVYAATYWGTPVAAKVIPDAATDRHARASAARAALANEAAHLRTLRHDNIVAYRGMVHLPDRGAHVLLTHTAAGGSAADLLATLDGAGRALRADAFLTIATQVVAALRYLHAVGVAHTELTAAHVLLSAPPVVDGGGGVGLPPNTGVSLCGFGAAVRFRPAGAAAGAPAATDATAAGPGGQTPPPPPPVRDLMAAGLLFPQLLLGGAAGAVAAAPATAGAAKIPPGTPVWPDASVRTPTSPRCRLAVTLPAVVALTAALTGAEGAARPSAAAAHLVLLTTTARVVAPVAVPPPSRERPTSTWAAARRGGWGGWWLTRPSDAVAEVETAALPSTLWSTIAAFVDALRMGTARAPPAGGREQGRETLPRGRG